LQQFTFGGDRRYGKPDSLNTNDHTKRVNDILSGWQRDADFE
jgi:hypothetical protein